MKKYLAIFDLDGTLFDTREVNFCSYRDALKEYGVELEREDFLINCFGRHYRDFLPTLMGTSEYIEDVHRIKTESYQYNLDKAIANAHLFRMIDFMKDSYFIAVVTTASGKNTKDILSYFGYLDYFDYVATQENITKKKPDPEGFLMVMNHFGMDAAHTVIFEDSDVGIDAARATGAAVLVVDTI